MYRNPNYELTHFGGSAYLLPSGQLLADYRHGLQLNRTGELIWGELELAQSREQLLARLQQVYEVTDQERPAFCSEINSFLDQLLSEGVLLEAQEPLACSFRLLSIAGKNLLLRGRPEAFSDEFEQFTLPDPDACSPDQLIAVTEAAAPTAEGVCILRHPHLTILESPQRYRLLFPQARGIAACILSRSGRNAVFHVKAPFDDALREDLFQGIRTVFLYRSLLQGMAALHSASILYRGKAWLFSGPSGTGKSTHTGLWQRQLGTPVINGDLNLLALDPLGAPVIRGMPWCGTSGICDNNSYPLGGIVLLKQDATNKLYPLTDSEKMLLVYQRIMSPRWDNALVARVCSLVSSLVPKIAVFHLGCTISTEAVSTIRAAIDALHRPI